MDNDSGGDQGGGEESQDTKTEGSGGSSETSGVSSGPMSETSSDTGEQHVQNSAGDTNEQQVQQPSDDTGEQQMQEPSDDTSEEQVQESSEDTAELQMQEPSDDTDEQQVQEPSDDTDEQQVQQPSGYISEQQVQQPAGTSLLALCERGEWHMFEQRLRTVEKGSPILSQGDPENGITPLMVAVKENRTVIIEKLLELGASINEQTKDGKTALHFAASYSREDTIRYLLGRKADPLIPAGPCDQLPLHMVCARAGAPVGAVQTLLRATGKDARLLKDQNGSLPLFLAVDAGNITVTKELLSLQSEAQLKAIRPATGDTALHLACRLRDPEIVKMLLDSGAAIDAKNKEGQTALHIAAYEGDETLVKNLIGMRANTNVLDKQDKSPLHVATERGHTNIVDLLIDKYKSSVAARTKDGSTLMHIASSYGHPDTALAFLKRGVPLLMPNKEGAICLHSAAMRGHLSVIKALLHKGAAVDAKTKNGYTALHLAVEHGKPQVVQILLGYGAQIDLQGGPDKETPLHIAARTRDGEKSAEMLLKSGASVDATKENGETPLHVAARCGQLNMIPALLIDGADPTAVSKSGETPVHIGVRFCHLPVIKTLLSFVSKRRSRMDAVMMVNQANYEGETPVHLAATLTQKQAHDEFEDTDIINYLLELQGDLNIQTQLTAETPLHYCARAGNIQIMLEMVRHIKANGLQGTINKQDMNGQSALLVASEQGHHEMVKILLKHHARVDVFDEHGKAALHLACENGHMEVADTLLWHKAFVNAKSKQGLSPLHLAAANGYNSLVQLLIDTHGATIDAFSLAKKTPLHMAAQMGQMEVCSTLLEKKADPNATDDRGQTPLHLAAGNDHSDVVKLFLKHRPELVTMANTNGMTCAHIAAGRGSVAVIKELMRFNKFIITTAKNKTKESSALHLAVAGGHKELVETLLEAGASPTDEDADGMTAIHLAAKYGHIAILDALKGFISYKCTSHKTGLTALHVAAHYGQTEFVREMLTRVPATLKSEVSTNPPTNFKDLAQESGLTPLHLAAQSGHEGVVRLLLNCPGVQVDTPSNVLGSLPIHYASQNGHAIVMSLLLSKSTYQLHVKDKRGRTALHLAAANGHLEMVALLLGQGADINACDKNGWSPLHFAAKAGYLAVVKHLVESGASPRLETSDGKVAVNFAAAANHSDVLSYLLKKDHSTQVLMEDKKFVFDLMQCGKLTLNKGLREFILLSPAPPDTAAKLSKTLRLLSIKEKERMKDLMAAADYCEAMATDLTAIAASHSSAQLILKAVDCHGAQFLDVLIENEQKEVVAHPSVQKYLSDVWIGGLNWSLWKIMLLFLSLLVIPVVWIAISLPTHNRLNKVPIVKFMTHLVSHIYMMLLYFFMVAMPLHNIYDSGSLIPFWNEWLLLAWLSGTLVSELTNPGDRAGLGWIQSINLGISALGIICHLIAFAYRDSDERYLLLYIRNNFFAWALLLSFVQLLDFLSFHHLFGPWAIIIRDLMRDLMRFLVILLIFMVGFTLHLSALYQPVYPESGDVPVGTGHLSLSVTTTSLSPISTFEFLFFALFGLVDPENLPPIDRSPVWVMDLVKVVFGTYMMVTLIVLINLLIAMMSDTYQRIQQQSDTEWKFGRAKLIRNMNKTSATPSPLNLFTKAYIYILVFFKYRGRMCGSQAQEFINQEEDLESMQGSQFLDTSTHGSMLKNLVRRNTQIAPDAGFLGAFNLRGHTRIEDVVEWPKVVQKYLLSQGQDEALEDLLLSLPGLGTHHEMPFRDDWG